MQSTASTAPVNLNAPRVGDLVGVDSPNATGTYRVAKVNPRTVTLTETTTAAVLKADRTMLVQAGSVFAPDQTRFTQAEALSADVLYSDDGGSTSCGRHLGSAGTGAVSNRPNAKSWTTYGPRGRMFRLPASEIRIMQREFTAAGLGTVACESCPA